jgi:hypothetical protein
MAAAATAAAPTKAAVPGRSRGAAPVNGLEGLAVFRACAGARLAQNIWWEQGEIMIRRLLISCVLLLAVTAGAQAAPRDEMMSGISRCAAIADNRTFLDCVYGAAQPLRAELGLLPASPAQVALVPPGYAGAPMPASQARPAAVPPPSHPGFMGRLLGSGEIITPATPMVSYFVNHNGYFTVTLKNGEVWQQNEGDENLANWHRPAATYIVSVVRGAMGSSNMQVKGLAEIYKVRRLH